MYKIWPLCSHTKCQLCRTRRTGGPRCKQSANFLMVIWFGFYKLRVDEFYDLNRYTGMSMYIQKLP
jgi:hypothetical protein